jgi:hypothetical protein
VTICLDEIPEVTPIPSNRRILPDNSASDQEYLGSDKIDGEKYNPALLSHYEKRQSQILEYKRQRLSGVAVAKVEKIIEPEKPGHILDVNEEVYKAFLVKRRLYFA